MFDPTAMVLADKATRHHLTSAAPTAPTEPELSPRRQPSTHGARTLIATALRRLATRVEPRTVQTCQS